MWLQAPNIRAKHGFSTRHGGVSKAAFQSLNLGGSEDLPENIAINRARALAKFSIPFSQVAFLKQVHGNDVLIARPGAQQGDALVTNVPGQAIAVSIADCYPIIFEDPIHQVIGAAHAGWRGTLAGIAKETIARMCELGARVENIHMAMGQGISADRFEVGAEVAEAFEKAQFPAKCFLPNKIDLIACNTFVAEQAGVLSKNIWAMQRCSFESDFFSYRRDKGITGRSWGIICLA